MPLFLAVGGPRPLITTGLSRRIPGEDKADVPAVFVGMGSLGWRCLPSSFRGLEALFETYSAARLPLLGDGSLQCPGV